MRSLFILIGVVLFGLFDICLFIDLGIEYQTIGHGLHPWIAFPVAFMAGVGILGYVAYWSYSTGANDTFHHLTGSEPTVI